MSRRNILPPRRTVIKFNENAFVVRDDQFLHQFVFCYCVTTRHPDKCEEGTGISPDVQAPLTVIVRVRMRVSIPISGLPLLLRSFSSFVSIRLILRHDNESQIRY
jgi:hypothetical protein